MISFYYAVLTTALVKPLGVTASTKLFGGGVNAFSRYDRGETMHSKSLEQLLKVLRKHGNNILDEIKAEENQAA